MTTETTFPEYRRGLELAEAGQYEQAWDCLREHLRMAPQDVPALNDAGVILHRLGHAEEALDVLTKARSLDADNAEIVGNLVETYLGAGRAVEAAGLCDDMERMGLLSIDVLNRVAALLLDQGHKGRAVEVLLRSDRLWPRQEVLPALLEGIRAKRPRIAFFRNGLGEDGALAEICAFVPQRFETKFYEGRQPEGIEKLMEWSDIAWFDGGGDLTVAASQRRRRTKMVASVRRSDVRDRWAREVRWENISVLAQIGSSAVEEALLPQVPDLRQRTRLTVVPNGINLRHYPLRRRDRGKHLACLDGLTLEANPGFLLQCMQKLHYLDPGYRLFFSGTFASPLLEQYVHHMVRTLDLTGVISFEPHPSDRNAWLSDKHFIVAGGIGESQVEALLAAMACGLKPVVHNFPGSDALLPPSYLFNIAEQFCEQVLSRDYQPRQYRGLVEERYPLEQQLRRVAAILDWLETEIELQTVAALGRKTTAKNPSDTCVTGDAMR
jgi:glycosyltransferase involved in cell wall biosynthesis